MNEKENGSNASAIERLAASFEKLEPAFSTWLTTTAKERRSAGVWSLFKRCGLVLMFALGLLVWCMVYGTALGVRPSIIKPTVAQVDIRGEIGGSNAASADNLVPMLTSLCQQPAVRGLVLHIDSPGGSPGDAERIGAAVDNCKLMPNDDGKSGFAGKRRVVAVIDGLGASAAYMISLHCDEIVVNRTGMVGSIGVIIEGLKFNGLMQKVGVTSFTYSSGQLKSMLSPYSEDSPAQQKVAQQLADDAMQEFKGMVIANRRKLKTDTPDLWSGRVWVASQALAIGLVDRIGLLEPVERQEFPHLVVQTFAPMRDMHSLLGTESWLEGLRSVVQSHAFAIQ
jgi:protease-4